MPISNGYRPETQATDELLPFDAVYYQSLIEILRWMVEIGRVGIFVEVSMLSYCLDMPREGHIQKLFNIFAYLNNHHTTDMVFDPSVPDFDADKFQRQDWYETVYSDAPPGLTT